MIDKKKQQAVEALIFASPLSVKKEEILLLLSNMSDNEETIENEMVDAYVAEIRKKHEQTDSVFELVEISEGYTFLTKKKYHFVLDYLYQGKKNKKLSRSALETLSIIAYKQPVTKQDVEQIRGVNSDYSVEKLLEKELVAIVGRATLPGRPLLYGVGQKFLDHLGLRTIEDLPKMKDMEFIENLDS